MTGKELTIRSLGVAGIIIILLLLLAKLFSGPSNKVIKQHFRNAISYTNTYEFDKALGELDTVLNMPKVSKDNKEIAQFMKQIIEALQQNPANTKLLNNLNELSAKSGLISKKDLDQIKLKGASSPKRQWAIRKKEILDELTALANRKPRNARERAAIEARKQKLLDELRSILDQEGGKGNGINDASSYYQEEMDKEKARQEKEARDAASKKKLAKDVANRKKRADQLAAFQKQQQAAQEEAARKLQLQPKQNSAAQAAKDARTQARAAQAQAAREAQARATAAREAQARATQAQAQAAREAQARAAQAQAQAAREAQARATAAREAQARAAQAQAQAAREAQARAAQAQAAREAQALKDAREKEAAKSKQDDQFDYLKKAAYEALAKERYDQAIDFANQAQSIKPDSEELHAIKALSNLRQNNQAQANQELQQAIAKDKGHFSVPLVQAEMLYTQGKEQEATSNYTKSNQRFNNALANYRLGTIALKNKQPQEASRYYNLAYTSPDKKYLEKSFHVRLAYNMGNSYRQLQQNNRAISLYREALTRDDDYLNARIALGQLYYGQRSYSKAIAELTKAYRQDSKNFFTLNLLGKTYHAQENYNKAEGFFQEASNIQPNDALTLYNLGTAQMENNNLRKAQNNLQKSLDLTPSDQTKAQLGLAYVKDGEFSTSSRLFKEVLANNPNEITALKGMGDLLSQQKQYPEALSYLQKAVTLNPKNSDVFYKMGVITYQQKNLSESINYFTQAYNLKSSSDIAYQLANVYFANSDLINAEKYYELSNRKKGNPEAQEGRANVSIKKKDFNSALQILGTINKQFPNYVNRNRVNNKIKNIQNIAQIQSQNNQAA